MRIPRMNMKSILAVSVMTFALLGSSSAQANFSFHERVTINAMKQAGKIIGARVALTLRPNVARDGAKIRIGLGRAGTTKLLDFRTAAHDMSKGYLVHQWPEHTAKGQPEPMTLEITYGRGNSLKGGESVDLVSYWPESRHVYGMRAGNVSEGNAPIFKLPADGQ